MICFRIRIENLLEQIEKLSNEITSLGVREEYLRQKISVIAEPLNTGDHVQYAKNVLNFYKDLKKRHQIKEYEKETRQDQRMGK